VEDVPDTPTGKLRHQNPVIGDCTLSERRPISDIASRCDRVPPRRSREREQLLSRKRQTCQVKRPLNEGLPRSSQVTSLAIAVLWSSIRGGTLRALKAIRRELAAPAMALRSRKDGARGDARRVSFTSISGAI
jgi:hypothetical protein